MSDADEIVELLVRQAERPRVARALLAAAEAAGLPAWVVQSQSNGYRVPASIADAADAELAADADVEPLPGTQVYAAAPPGGKVTYERDLGPGEVEQAEAEELPAPVPGRKSGGRK